MRLFVALHLCPEVRFQLAQVLDEVRGLRGADQVKWTAADSIHLTLRFLGEVSEAQLPELKQGLAAAVEGRPAPALALGSIGAFPDLRRPRVLWVGLETSGSALADLQAAVEAAAVEAGWESEGRVFQPHLTLGRVRAERRSPPVKLDAGLLERLRQVHFEPKPPQLHTQVALIRSHLGPGGSRYEDLQCWALAAP